MGLYDYKIVADHISCIRLDRMARQVKVPWRLLGVRTGAAKIHAERRRADGRSGRQPEQHDLPNPIAPARFPPFHDFRLGLIGFRRATTPTGAAPYRRRQTARSSAWSSSASWSSADHPRTVAPPGTPSGHLGVVGGQSLPQPLLGLLAGCNGVIALLLGLLPAVPLGGQFVLHPLESLFDNLLLAVRPLDRLIPGEPLMGQFGLEVVDRRLGLLEQMFRMLSCRDLLPQSLPRCVELVGAGTRHPDPGG